MKNLFLTSLFAVIFLGVSAQEEILLYPNGTAESNGLQEVVERGGEYKRAVSEAKMYSYIVPQEQSSGAAVLICPGGGYSGIAFVKEGNEVAQWFNRLGISAFVLHYRMPNGHCEIPLKDAQTAMEQIYANAKKWHINRKKIGVMGFSAGGHLASTVGTQYSAKANKPAFMLLIYPVITMDSTLTHGGSRAGLIGKTPSNDLIRRFSSELNVTKQTPKTFLAAAEDDHAVPIENSERFYNALQTYKVPATLLRLENGGHGFGMRLTGKKSDYWELELEKWLKINNFTFIK